MNFLNYISIVIQHFITYLSTVLLRLNHLDKILEIKDGGKLFIGDMISSTNKSYLEKNKINLIINCTKDLPFIKDKKYLKYRLKVSDFSLNIDKENEMLIKNINKYLYIIDVGLRNNKNILIHCRNGIQRSATLIACYLIKYHSYNKKTAIQYIKEKRKKSFFPFIIFNSVINDIEKKNSK